jgi:hypothetical protein
MAGPSPRPRTPAKLARGATEPLPPLYASWLDQLLGDSIPRESEATCDDCPMCPKGGRQKAAEQFFDPYSKCCTYTPNLPNYLVGRIITDTDPAFARGRASVEERMRSGVGVTPLGLAPPASRTLLYQHVTAEAEGFGRARALRCAHYLDEAGGRCGIWRHRNSVCSTWFCKHVRGAVGMRFWKSILGLLIAVEAQLATWCVLELDPGAEALARLFPPPGDRPPSEKLRWGDIGVPADERARRAIWGSWWQREEAFYAECARRVNALDWNDVVRIGGPEIGVRSSLAKDRFAALTSEELPSSLEMGRYQVVSSSGAQTRIQSYSGGDLVDLPKELVDVLHRFDGRPVARVLNEIATKDGLSIERDLLLKLVDFEILMPAGAALKAAAGAAKSS